MDTPEDVKICHSHASLSRAARAPDAHGKALHDDHVSGGCAVNAGRTLYLLFSL
jgi:hypothetical protein